MAIDAVLVRTEVSEDGRVGVLYLDKRTEKNPAGQNQLFVDEFDGWFPPLGSELWGGASEIMIGEEQIYKRTSMTHVVRTKKEQEVVPTEEGKVKYPDTEGYWEDLPCTCMEECE